jgi:hypothetical protein
MFEGPEGGGLDGRLLKKAGMTCLAVESVQSSAAAANLGR